MLTAMMKLLELTRRAGQAGLRAVARRHEIAIGCTLAAAVFVAGCQSGPPKSGGKTPPVAPAPAASPAAGGSADSTNASTNASSKSLVLQEGDTIKISFPGAPNLDTTQPIRRDG